MERCKILGLNNINSLKHTKKKKIIRKVKFWNFEIQTDNEGKKKDMIAVLSIYLLNGITSYGFTKCRPLIYLACY